MTDAPWRWTLPQLRVALAIFSASKTSNTTDDTCSIRNTARAHCVSCARGAAYPTNVTAAPLGLSSRRALGRHAIARTRRAALDPTGMHKYIYKRLARRTQVAAISLSPHHRRGPRLSPLSHILAATSSAKLRISRHSSSQPHRGHLSISSWLPPSGATT